jgi:hypothetical protein
MPRLKTHSLKRLLKDLRTVTGKSSRFGNYIGSEEEELEAKQVKDRLNNKKELLQLINNNSISSRDTLSTAISYAAQDHDWEWGYRVKHLIKSLGLPITDNSTIGELRKAI